MQCLSLQDHTLVIKRIDHKQFRSRDGVVGIATGYEGVGVRAPVGSRIFSSKSSRPTPGPTQPPIKWLQGESFPGVRLHGREADHPPPTSIGIK
jgi:hypothetical protein